MAELDLPSFKKYSIFINFWELFIIYFNHIQYPFFSSNSSQIHPTSLPNFILSLSLCFHPTFPPSLPLSNNPPSPVCAPYTLTDVRVIHGALLT